MSDLSKAEARAKALRDDLLRTDPLQGGKGLVAYYETDMGLRSFGQFSLIQGLRPGYGLVIRADGTIPRDAEASEMLKEANQAPHP